MPGKVMAPADLTAAPVVDEVRRAGRLAALDATALLDSEAEPAFDRLTRMVTTVLGVPVSLVSLVDRDRQFFKSQQGLPEPWASARETPLTHSFCQHVVAEGAPLIVTDSATDPRVEGNLAIPDLGVAAYAGFPITANGEVIGSLCAIDSQPRAWTDRELDVLRELAALVETELALRAALERSARDTAALAESERKFRAVFEDAGIGIVITDLDGRLLDLNAAYERLTGYTREELLSTSYSAVTHPEDAIEQRRLADAMLAGEIDQLRMDKRYIRSDGTMVWGRLTATVMRTADGVPRSIIGAVEDITLRLRIADGVRMLADAGALLTSTLDYAVAVPAAIRLALPRLGDAAVVQLPDEDGGVEALCLDTLPDRQAVLCDLSAGWDLETRPETLSDLQAMGLARALRIPLVGRDGGAVGALIFLGRRATLDADDVVLAEELARRVTAAVENSRAFADAQAATRARDEVLAVVSHDLRNPIHTIAMAAALLIDLPDLEPAARITHLGVVRRSASRANRLINDLLEITRIENGQLRLERRSVAVVDIVTEAVQVADGAARARDITLVGTAGDDVTRVHVDRDRIVQALDNLIGNAVKFTPPGGRVEVRARCVPDGTCFEVIDTGPGIPVDAQAHLFTRFWQARRNDRRGVGLGLSIVKGIVDAHGGDIAIASDGQSGTTVSITIPDAPAAIDGRR